MITGLRAKYVKCLFEIFLLVKLDKEIVKI